MNNHIVLFKYFTEKKGMYVVNDNYENICSFISGFDFATNHQLLKGFNNWLYIYYKEESSLYWGNYILYKNNKLGKTLSAKDNEIMVQSLFNLIFEFRAIKDTKKGKKRR